MSADDATSAPVSRASIAFETEIAEPDRDGGALRYRGVDIEELVGRYPFENVWGLLVDEDIDSPLPPAEAIELQDPSGSVPADLQAALATLGPKWGLEKLVDIDDEQARDDLARLSSATLTIVAQAARGKQPAVPESEIEQGENAAAKFLIRWRGEADPRAVQGARHLLDLRRRARPERLDVHRAHRRLDGRRLRRGAVVGGRHALRPAARRRACARAADDRRRRRGGRPRALRARHARPAASASWASATASTARTTRAPACSRRTAQELGSPRVEVARRSSRRRSKVLREKSPDRAARDERRVLGGGRARHRRDPCRRSRRRCSAARASRAGRRTFSSRSAPDG